MKTVLITGASSGIGAALAHLYAARGARLLLSGRSVDRLGAVADSCRAAGSPDIHHAAIDVLDRDVMHHWILGLDKRFPIDTVIANAGISGGTGHQVLETDDHTRLILSTSITGTLNTIQPILPRMIERGQGQIAVMASLASFSAWPGAPAYAAAKAAVRVYGEGLRMRLRPCGVNVSVICPGFVDTPLTRVNPYRMPLLMDADRAARRIASGLDRNVGRIAFPWPTYLVAGVIGMLPAALQEKILQRMPAKPAPTSQS